MRITILAMGSRGDVQPAAVLGVELLHRGHEVVPATTDDLEPFGETLALPVVSFGFDLRAFLRSPEGQTLLKSRNVREYLAGFVQVKLKHAQVMRAAMLTACAEADVIVSDRLLLDEASSVAEANGARFVGLHHAPREPNSHFTSFMLTQRRAPRPLNRATHLLFDRLEWKATAASVNQFRAAIGLAATTVPVARRLARAQTLELQAYSPVLVPELSTWSPRFPLTGFITPSPQQRQRWGRPTWRNRCRNGWPRAIRRSTSGSAACPSPIPPPCSPWCSRCAANSASAA
ncbi:glycosyltransferase [Kineococcus sp. GCM10028916]|uniref:glycosyltransferase n=1 Tax=Kineococcus sp. GCM10028916 TaxID=3273394 RepID=UPI003625EAA4